VLRAKEELTLALITVDPDFLVATLAPTWVLLLRLLNCFLLDFL
jgi:hypothetical protein